MRTMCMRTMCKRTMCMRTMCKRTMCMRTMCKRTMHVFTIGQRLFFSTLLASSTIGFVFITQSIITLLDVAKSFQISLPAFIEAGSTLETSFSPLVLFLHMVIIGGGVALAQLFLQPLEYGIAGTGVSAGLVIAMMVHKLRSSMSPMPSPAGMWMLGTAPLFALHQPLLGVW